MYIIPNGDLAAGAALMSGRHVYSWRSMNRRVEFMGVEAIRVVERDNPGWRSTLPLAFDDQRIRDGINDALRLLLVDDLPLMWWREEWFTYSISDLEPMISAYQYEAWNFVRRAFRRQFDHPTILRLRDQVPLTNSTPAAAPPIIVPGDRVRAPDDLYRVALSRSGFRLLNEAVVLDQTNGDGEIVISFRRRDAPGNAWSVWAERNSLTLIEDDEEQVEESPTLSPGDLVQVTPDEFGRLRGLTAIPIRNQGRLRHLLDDSHAMVRFELDGTGTLARTLACRADHIVPAGVHPVERENYLPMSAGGGDANAHPF